MGRTTPEGYMCTSVLVAGLGGTAVHANAIALSLFSNLEGTPSERLTSLAIHTTLLVGSIYTSILALRMTDSLHISNSSK